MTAANTADVVKAVRFAAAHRIRVSAQPSGHGATRALDDTIVVRTAALDDIWIDTAARTARVGAGVKWGALQSALDGTALTGLVGSNPDVSVVGFCLSGGLSWLTRPYGPGSGSLSAVELVDAEGVHRWVSDDESPELMWALRGGGGEFGIVTAVEIDLFPAPELTGGRLVFPATEARSVLRAVTALTAVARAELTVWASIMHFPPIPDLPEEIRDSRSASSTRCWSVRPTPSRRTCPRSGRRARYCAAPSGRCNQATWQGCERNRSTGAHRTRRRGGSASRQRGVRGDDADDRTGPQPARGGCKGDGGLVRRARTLVGRSDRPDAARTRRIPETRVRRAHPGGAAPARAGRGSVIRGARQLPAARTLTNVRPAGGPGSTPGHLCAEVE
ncbi:FAD-binding oxidoreductase [Prescottella defluvii]|nr:FAD-binding oxidoreductase [Prescottella defluvii]